MDKEILIREAEAGEVDRVEALVKGAYAEFRLLYPEEVWQAWMENVSKTIHSPAGILLVALHQGELAGAVKFYPDASQAGLGHWPPGAASIRLMAVDPKHRGKGVGILLAQECLRRAKALGLQSIYLYTGEYMYGARKIYERLGFVRVPEYDKIPGPIAYHLDLTRQEKSGEG